MPKPYFPEFSNGWPALVEALKSKKVAVIGHIRPDGDCMGSQVGLTRILNQLSIETTAVNRDPYPREITEFVGDTPVALGEAALNRSFDVAITVDCSAMDRIGEELATKVNTVYACIDHHITNPLFAEVNWVPKDAAATAEVIAGIAFDNGISIDPITAQALYVGIATDTGQFRYAATTQRVFDICGQLMEHGANPNTAAQSLYERQKKGRVELLKAYLNTLQFYMDDQLCIGQLTPAMFEAAGSERTDAEGFVDYARNVETVKIACILEEQPDGSTKGSLRAKESRYRVDQLAGYFGGGGHTCAAGFGHPDSPESFLPIFIEKTREHLQLVEQS